jgi:ketosteroid isomerase-like protein
VSGDNVEMVRSFFEVFGRGDVDAVFDAKTNDTSCS